MNDSIHVQTTNLAQKTVSLGMLGSVTLVDAMPQQHGDLAVVEAARRSVDRSTSTPAEDRALIRRLMRCRHTSPFEMVEFKFYIECPIFVARQWLRHRTANVNELSGRYAELNTGYYIPPSQDIRLQSKKDKQGSFGTAPLHVGITFTSELSDNVAEADTAYRNALAADITREQARIGLPLCTMTNFYWKIDLHNLFHFLKLRMDSHAQDEIRSFARTMYNLIKPHVPICCEAFEDYILNSINLSVAEQALVGQIVKGELAAGKDVWTKLGKSERDDFWFKLEQLGISAETRDKCLQSWSTAKS